MDTSTYCGALRYGVSKIREEYPHIKIYLIGPIYRVKNGVSSDTAVNSNGLKLTDYCQAMKSVADEYGLPYLDQYTAVGINGENYATYLRQESGDNYTHPTDAGIQLIAKSLAGFLRINATVALMHAGNVVLPRTAASAVIMPDGRTVEDTIVNSGWLTLETLPKYDGGAV